MARNMLDFDFDFDFDFDGVVMAVEYFVVRTPYSSLGSRFRIQDSGFRNQEARKKGYCGTVAQNKSVCWTKDPPEK